MRRLHVCGLAIALLAGGGAVAAVPGSPPSDALTSRPQTVPVTTVRMERLERTLSLPGELAAFQNVAVYPRVQGFVEWIGVDRGSSVRRGDALVRIHAPELAAQRAEAAAKAQGVRAQWQEAEAKLAADAATYRRLKAAASVRGTVAGNEVEIAQHTLEAARERARAWQESAAAARQALKAVEEMEAYLRVSAPFDGVITERNVHEGSFTGPTVTQAPMLRVQEVSRLRLVLGVPEAEVGGAHAGLAATFRVPAWPATVFTARVARIARALDPRTRTLPVELDVENADGRLAPGMYAQVSWPARRPEPVPVVPSSAVVTTTERTFVIAVRDDRARWIDVRRGMSRGDEVEVFGSLAAGERVVGRASDEIRDGSPVVAASGKAP